MLPPLSYAQRFEDFHLWRCFDGLPSGFYVDIGAGHPVYDNVSFPKHIEINRPRDEYAVVIDIVKMDINKGVSTDKFALEQPEGTTLQVVGETPPASQTPAPPATKGRVKKK